MSKIVVIGAGKTGRGFIARLLQEEQEEIIFIDKNAELVEKLNAKKEFRISFFGNVREPYVVNRFQAYTWENASLEDAELILVSVGGQNLKDVGESLANLLENDKHYYIITGENASHPSKTLREAIGKENISVSEATVFCTTIEEGGLDINSENYPYLQCDADLLEGFVPAAKTIKPIAEFSNFLTRKLFTYNAASCVISYLGWSMGYSNYADAANDEKILQMLDANYAVTNKVLCAEFGYEKKDQEEFAALSKRKFCDRTIVDTVARNARDPQRKLGANERIIGPIKLLHKYGEDASVLEQTAAAAILYDQDGEDAWRALKAEKTNEQILTDICGLEVGSTIFNNIMSYIEKGRCPWKYRPAGSAMVKPDAIMPYPRVCAHRGFNTIAPENSMPAFGAAVALGADEIEFDLWPTKDGEIVSCHDDTLNRVSDGTGKIYEHTYEELKELDFGSKFGEKFKGLPIVLFEDILKKFGGHTIMNVHVKTLSDTYDEAMMKKIVSLIRKYECEKYVYFMISHDGVIRQFKEYAPDIRMCVGHLDSRPWEIVERAIELGAEKVQLFKPYFNQKIIDKAHRHGIRCNVFFSDEVEETKNFIEMGIDTILTNDYLQIANAVKVHGS